MTLGFQDIVVVGVHATNLNTLHEFELFSATSSNQSLTGPGQWPTERSLLFTVRLHRRDQRLFERMESRIFFIRSFDAGPKVGHIPRNTCVSFQSFSGALLSSRFSSAHSTLLIPQRSSPWAIPGGSSAVTRSLRPKTLRFGGNGFLTIRRGNEVFGFVLPEAA